ncbi:hypothetical protein [Streptomyces sp. NPDC048277]|uniref:hypothetical protein n=1 Tax=Streptomyces sp. NPDC048277 TaxID=3155027 RepID=UPI0033FECD69
MPHTTASATAKPRTGRSAPGAGTPTWPRPSTAATVMPLWQGLALLFAPAKPERP